MIVEQVQWRLKGVEEIPAREGRERHDEQHVISGNIDDSLKLKLTLEVI